MSKPYKRDLVALLKNITRVTVGPSHEPLLVHAKTCDGCRDCAQYLPILQWRKKILSKECVSGISWAKVIDMRHTHTIFYYYPNGDELRKPNGKLDPEVYIKLKYDVDGPDGKGFTDEQIWDYFHINKGESQRFKKEYFPNWSKESKEEIFNNAEREVTKKFDGKQIHKATPIRFDPNRVDNN